MNRTIWIWRMIAILIIIIFTVLMWSLYARLEALKEQRGPGPSPPAAEQVDTEG